jgi:hypothetical protein
MFISRDILHCFVLIYAVQKYEQIVFLLISDRSHFPWPSWPKLARNGEYEFSKHRIMNFNEEECEYFQRRMFITPVMIQKL